MWWPDGRRVNDAPALAQTSAQPWEPPVPMWPGRPRPYLVDDNFATIVAAVAEGRTIYANIRKAIQHLYRNMGELWHHVGNPHGPRSSPHGYPDPVTT